LLVRFVRLLKICPIIYQKNLIMKRYPGQSGHEVVIICPRGGGAKKTFSYLKSQGVAETKLFILTGGEEKWPHRVMLVTGK